MNPTPKESIFSALTELADDFAKSIETASGRTAALYGQMEILTKHVQEDLASATPGDFEFAHAKLGGLKAMCESTRTTLSGSFSAEKRKWAMDFNLYAIRLQEIREDVAANRDAFVTPPTPARS